MRALRVAVTSSILGASLVARVLGQSTVGVHLDEVDGTVETTRKIRHVDVESELLILELEHVVGGVTGHQINARTDVGAGDKFQGEGVSRSGDSVGTSVVSTIDRTVLGARCTVWAEGGVPSVTGVAVGGATRGVEPAPVRVEDDGSLGRGATAALGTFLRRELRMGLGDVCANLLAAHRGEKREGDERNGVRP
jgi:hypothetical protein